MPATLTDLLTRCARSARRDAAPDGDLLRRVAGERDGEALAELVRRHAGLVWGVCRRRLRHEPDAEDAFQAVFLALVRQAPRLDAGRPLAGWLHTVADRVARKAQARALKRAAREVAADPAGPADVPAEVGGREFLAAVDAAIAHLPQRFREPVLLCCVQGLTRDEAAEVIGCSVPALKARLERGRRTLRRALERRGVALPAALLAVGLGTVPVGAALRERAVATALGTPSPVVAALVARSTPVPWAVGLSLVAAAVVGLGAFGFGQVPPTDAPRAKESPPVARADTRPAADRLGDPLPEAALLRLGTLRFRHPGTAHALALSPDEKTVLTLGHEGLYAWDTATGKERWHAAQQDLKGYRGMAVGERPVVILPDSKRAVTPANAGFTVWDLATGKGDFHKVEGGPAARGPSPFNAVDVTPDGKTLALGGPAEVVVCDLDGKVRGRIANRPVNPQNANLNNRLLPIFDGFGYPRFAPDGKSLAVVTSDNPTDVRLCDLDGNEVRHVALTKHYLDAAFSPDGTLLAVAEHDDTVRVYEVESGKRKHEWPVKITRARANENYLFAVAFTQDGKTLAAGASDKLIHLWDVPTGKKLGELEGHAWYPWALAFTRDGKTLYSTGWDGDIRRWDVAARRQRPLPQGVRGTALAAASPDGKTVVYADGDHNLRFVDARTGEERSVVTIPGFDPDQVAFRADGKQMAVGGKAGDKVAVCLLDLPGGKVARRFEWSKGNDPHASVEDLAFSPDGRQLAAMSFRNQSAARVWDLTADKEPLVLKHREGYSLSFSPDGKTLVTGGWDRVIRFWDPADGKLKKEFLVALPKDFATTGGLRDDVRVFAVAWSPDGSRIAAADLGGNLWLWDADTMRLRALADTKDIPRYNTLAWSPDGLWVATGGASGKVRLWDGWSGQLVWDRGRHRTNLFRVGFGKDSRTLVSGADDGLGYRWDLRPKDAPNDKPADLWPALIGSDGPAAYRAFWAMLDQPEAAVAALAGLGQTFTATVDPARVRQWVADLDAPKFAVREAAERELAARLRAAVPLLRAALAKGTEEQRARIRKLLDVWEASRTGRLRAVSVLAHLDTPAAKQVLADWAKADPNGDLGRAAAAALK